MPKTSIRTPLRQLIDRLAAFEPTPLPVISLYLDLRPNQHGRDNYSPFVRRAFAEQLRPFEGTSPTRVSFEHDVEQIEAYLASELEPSSQGAAIFACSGQSGLFEAMQFDAPFEEHFLSVSNAPQLYPLARLDDQYPRYAAVLLDTASARIFVFAMNATERREEVQGVKTRGRQRGGWSQSRYQRRIDSTHAQHMKEVAERLDRIVTADGIDRIVISGDEAAVPLFRGELPKRLAEKVIDTLSLTVGAPEDEVLRETLESLRRKDAESDEERVGDLIDAWRGNQLAVVGADAVRRALEMGQVEELVIAASAQALDPRREAGTAGGEGPEPKTAGGTATDQPEGSLQPAGAAVHAAGELVAKASQTGARIRFIENSPRLQDLGGVGALLRFRI